MRPLTIHGCGAVTPVGLTALQSCAAIRARISRITATIPRLPPENMLRGARVAARRDLRRSPREWLLNLAARAISECLQGQEYGNVPIALLIAPPEPFRNHPGGDLSDRSLIQQLESRVGVTFHPRSAVLKEGPAAVFEGFNLARKLCEERAAEYCLVGGVDSLLNESDIVRLSHSGRLHGPGNPQGVIPGEGAAFVLVSANLRGPALRPLCQILGVGVGKEPDSVLGPRYSVGRGMFAALTAAIESVPGGEASLGFVTSSFNGERYGGWEAMLTRPRFYRAKRPELEIVYPAMSVGEMGTAAAALAIIVAGMAIARGYAPDGPAMCEAYSDGGLRAACVIAAAPESPVFVRPGERAGLT